MTQRDGKIALLAEILHSAIWTVFMEPCALIPAAAWQRIKNQQQAPMRGQVQAAFACVTDKTAQLALELLNGCGMIFGAETVSVGFIGIRSPDPEDGSNRVSGCVFYACADREKDS